MYFSIEEGNLSFSELNSIKSAKNYRICRKLFSVVLKTKITKIGFYKLYICRFCRILLLVILKTKITKNGFLQILYILWILKNSIRKNSIININ